MHEASAIFIKKALTIQSQYDAHAIVDFLPGYQNNRISISRLSKITAHVGQTKTYGVKYVIKERETYFVNQQRYSVSEGQYLVVNKGQDLGVDYKEKQTVYGLCAYLDEKFLGKTYHSLLTEEATLLDHPFDEEITLPEFHETVYSSDDCIGNYLKNLATAKDTGKENCADVYYNLAYRLVVAQKITSQRIQKIKASKASTKKELFNRLNTAKNIMDDDFTHKMSVADLAREAALSEFHFFRSFKEAFGQSPHQYMIGKRLNLAKELLLKDAFPVTEVAYQAGFNDIFSFSKAFKKQFSLPPSKIKQAN